MHLACDIKKCQCQCALNPLKEAENSDKLRVLFVTLTVTLTVTQELNSGLADHRTGCILWPGEKFQSVSCDQRWGYDIVMDVTTIDTTNNTRRRREVVQDYDFEESEYVELENLNNLSGEDDSDTETGEFFINKTTDQVNIYLPR